MRKRWYILYMNTLSEAILYAQTEQIRRRKSLMYVWGVSLLLFASSFLYEFFLVGIKPQTALIRASSLSGVILISAALFSSALFKWRPRWAVHWKVRRYLGISGFVLIFIHVTSVVQLIFGGNIGKVFYEINPIKNPLIFGFISYIILFTLFLTSTDWAVKKLTPRHWKTIHRLVYVAYPLSIFHFALTNPAALYNPFGYLLIAMTACAVFGQLYWFVRIASRKKFLSKGSIIGILIIISSLFIAYLAFSR